MAGWKGFGTLGFSLGKKYIPAWERRPARHREQGDDQGGSPEFVSSARASRLRVGTKVGLTWSCSGRGDVLWHAAGAFLSNRVQRVAASGGAIRLVLDVVVLTEQFGV